MADEKEVVPAAMALKRVVTPPTGAPTVPAPTEQETAEALAKVVADAAARSANPVKKWKFVKNFGVADVLKFKDGSTFTFRQINRNTDFGVLPNSFIVTSDEVLANNLREAASNPYTGVVEVPA